jgi:hypothetical protein
MFHIIDLEKSVIKQHVRKTKSGKVAIVKQHTDKRSKKEKTKSDRIKKIKENLKVVLNRENPWSRKNKIELGKAIISNFNNDPHSTIMAIGDLAIDQDEDVFYLKGDKPIGNVIRTYDYIYFKLYRFIEKLPNEKRIKEISDLFTNSWKEDSRSFIPQLMQLIIERKFNNKMPLWYGYDCEDKWYLNVLQTKKADIIFKSPMMKDLEKVFENNYKTTQKELGISRKTKMNYQDFYKMSEKDFQKTIQTGLNSNEIRHLLSSDNTILRYGDKKIKISNPGSIKKIDKNKKYIPLFRGVAKKYNIHSPLESWTTNVETAESFDGASLICKIIPIENIFSFWNGSTWKKSKNSIYKTEKEYVVIGGGEKIK